MAAAVPKPAQGVYTFSSQPRAVVPQRKKYRETDSASAASGSSRAVNIMQDPRVVRGNTYRRTSLASAGDTQKAALSESQRRRQSGSTMRRSSKDQQASVDPVPGRAHMEIQTEQYLEELTDKVDEKDVDVQTDPFMDRPPSPLYIPPKTGVDKATQIEDGELFDFDLEVQPILEVLVGKTLEQALMEVMEEQELEQLRQHQREFEELRAAELMEVQRLEEQARRRREEKNRRVKQQSEAEALERETREKIAARAFAQSYLNELLPSVFGALEENGFLFDTQEHEVETEFVPWLDAEVAKRLALASTARGLLDALILDVVNQRREAYGPPPAEPAAAAPAPAAMAAAAVHQPEEPLPDQHHPEPESSPAAAAAADDDDPKSAAEEPTAHPAAAEPAADAASQEDADHPPPSSEDPASS